MTTIEIDFEVLKALMIRRATESVSYNDVLRDMLGLAADADVEKTTPATSSRYWVTKGVRFPENSEFRATYKGKRHSAKVQNGALLLDGKKYFSPSSAATSITGNPVNGWIFWECCFPGESQWKVIKALRS